MAISDDTTVEVIAFRIPWYGRALLSVARALIWLAKRLTILAAHTSVVDD